MAAPHVDVDLAALDSRAGIQDGVDAVVVRLRGVDLDDRTERQQGRIGRRYAGLSRNTRRLIRPSQ